MFILQQLSCIHALRWICSDDRQLRYLVQIELCKGMPEACSFRHTSHEIDLQS